MSTEPQTTTVGIIGLGYVGLPLAVAFAEAGCRVIGFDVDADKVAALGRGASYIEDVADERLAGVGDALRATTEPEVLAQADALIVCVPTPLTPSRDPDLGPLHAATDLLRAVLRPGQLIVLESTTYPGTTRELLQPALESTGLVAGSDFHLAFSPERVDPGRTDYVIRNTPKVVGAVTPACLERALALYDLVCDELVPVSTPEAAELSKLLENIFRSVNIALVNEIAILCDRMGIDVWEVVDAAATKPYGFMGFKPGPGMGGHCLPVDPFYLSWRARQFDVGAEFVELAGKVNRDMPNYCVHRIERALNDLGTAASTARVTLLGVSYKAGVGDTRESPALKILALLRKLGTDVSYHDPFVPELPTLGLASVDLDEVRRADLAVIVTDHPGSDYVSLRVPLLDLRGATRGQDLPKRTFL